MQKLIPLIVVVVLAIVYSATYVVDQRERALLFRLGEIIKEDIPPGLHFKYPLINNARFFDARILTLDAQPESFLTVEKKNVTVDFFVKWRIQEVGQYYRATRGDERNALSRLSQIMKDRLRNEFGKRTIQEAVSGERSEIMDILKVKSNETAKELGIEIVDVRISRIDLPDDVSDAVYARMRAERQRVARDFRARGMEQAERIRADADRERIEILAEAYRESEKIRGEGDAESAKIYADAYNRDAEFYSFTRSIKAYEDAFGGADTLILEPESDFFNYFNTKDKEYRYSRE
ncbi:MAG: protease modulator HflC [Gammaproteobacteria bacterium]|nr:protease modulator HflC [Gammaproteobacteria bacterium]